MAPGQPEFLTLFNTLYESDGVCDISRALVHGHAHIHTGTKTPLQMHVCAR
jgi:hypothetical protein